MVIKNGVEISRLSGAESINNFNIMLYVYLTVLEQSHDSETWIT